MMTLVKAVFIPSSPAVIKHPLPCFRSSLEQTKKLERELLYPSSDLIHDFGETKHFKFRWYVVNVSMTTNP